MAERVGSESLDETGNDGFLSQIDVIHQLQQQFELPQPSIPSTSTITATSSNSTLYPPLKKLPEPDLARVMMSSLASISSHTFSELLPDGDAAEMDAPESSTLNAVSSTLVSRRSVLLPAISTHNTNNNNSRTSSTHNNNKTSLSRSTTSSNIINTNNTVAYAGLASAVDAFLASSVQRSVIDTYQPVILVAVQQKRAIMEELVRLQRDSIRLRGLRDDGMKLTTNLRKFVFSTLIHQMLS